MPTPREKKKDLNREIDRLDRLIEWKEKEHQKIVARASARIEAGAPYDVLKDEEERILRELEELEKKRKELIKKLVRI